MLVAGMSRKIPLMEDMDYIGIDRGALIAMEQGIVLRAAIGDFDSMSDTAYQRLCAYTKVYKLPTHKNETDSEEAIDYAIKEGYEEIILFGGLGGRIDHELANLHLMIHRQLPITLMDENNLMKVITPGVYHIEKKHKYLSFLALEESFITETGVEYPLYEQQIYPCDIYSISNEIQGAYADVILHGGRMLMIQSDDEKA